MPCDTSGSRPQPTAIAEPRPPPANLRLTHPPFIHIIRTSVLVLARSDSYRGRQDSYQNGRSSRTGTGPRRPRQLGPADTDPTGGRLKVRHDHGERYRHHLTRAGRDYPHQAHGSLRADGSARRRRRVGPYRKDQPPRRASSKDVLCAPLRRALAPSTNHPRPRRLPGVRHGLHARARHQEVGWRGYPEGGEQTPVFEE